MQVSFWQVFFLAQWKNLHRSSASFFLCKYCRLLLFYFILLQVSERCNKIKYNNRKMPEIFAEFLCESCRLLLFYFILFYLSAMCDCVKIGDRHYAAWCWGSIAWLYLRQYTVNTSLWCAGAGHAATARNYATRVWAGVDFSLARIIT